MIEYREGLKHRLYQNILLDKTIYAVEMPAKEAI